jgi:RES domain-containing protein
MIVWRLTTAPFADLTGEGARIAGGRWNSPGRPVLYTALSPALAILETRVHLDLPFDLLPDNYVLVQIDTHDLPFDQIPLPSDPEDCRTNGDLWLDQAHTALLQVPSVIAPICHNLLINPRHPDARSLATIAVEPYQFDQRLWAGGAS